MDRTLLKSPRSVSSKSSSRTAHRQRSSSVRNGTRRRAGGGNARSRQLCRTGAPELASAAPPLSAARAASSACRRLSPRRTAAASCRSPNELTCSLALAARRRCAGTRAGKGVQPNYRKFTSEDWERAHPTARRTTRTRSKSFGNSHVTGNISCIVGKRSAVARRVPNLPSEIGVQSAATLLPSGLLPEGTCRFCKSLMLLRFSGDLRPLHVASSRLAAARSSFAP